MYLLENPVPRRERLVNVMIRLFNARWRVAN
jgi:hypothetical protein